MAHLIPGVEFDFGGGRVYTLAPLPLIAVKSMQKRLLNLTLESALSPESIDTIYEASFESLKRNHPDITMDEVGNLVDVANMLDVINLLLDVGGFKRKALADGVDPKNLPAQPLG